MFMKCLELTKVNLILKLITYRTIAYYNSILIISFWQHFCTWVSLEFQKKKKRKPIYLKMRNFENDIFLPPWKLNLEASLYMETPKKSSLVSGSWESVIFCRFKMSKFLFIPFLEFNLTKGRCWLPPGSAVLISKSCRSQ